MTSVENDIVDNETLEEQEEQVPLTKTKKPRSQKQIEAYEIMMSKRTENIRKRKEDKILKEAEKIRAVKKEEPKPEVIEKPVAVKKQKKVVIYESESDSSSSEEEIIYKKKRKPKSKPVSKKQKKKVVYYSSSSSEIDSSSSSDEEETKDNVSINRNVGYRNYFV
jgi:hypothetical protein